MANIEGTAAKDVLFGTKEDDLLEGLKGSDRAIWARW